MPNDVRVMNPQNPLPSGSERPRNSARVEEVTDTVRYVRNEKGRGPYDGPIPRLRPLREAPRDDGTVRKAYPIRRFDTFGENAIETIYDEFRFLDEPNAPSPSSSGAPILEECRTPEKRHYSTSMAYCVLPLAQLVFSVTVFVMASLRFVEFYPNNSTKLVDFEHSAMDYTSIEGLDSFRFHSSVSLLLPSFFEAIAAVFGFWPVARNLRRPFQALHMLFCVLSIPSWLSALEWIAMELNLNVVYQLILPENAIHVAWLALLVFSFFVGVVLPSVTVVVAARRLIRDRSHGKSIPSTCLAIGTALVSATVLCFSAFACSRSLTVLSNTPNGTNQSIFYGFGIRELLVSTHILLCSIFYFFSSLHNDSGMTVAAIVLQFTNLQALSSLLFPPSRVVALLTNIAVLSQNGAAKPVKHTSLVLLYSLAASLLLLLLVQLICTMTSLRKGAGRSELPTHDEHQRTTF